MKAVILAAGLGSRLHPITNEVQKCVMPVNGIRIIEKPPIGIVASGLTMIVSSNTHGTGGTEHLISHAIDDTP